MPLAPRDQWFVIQVLSGHEKKIRDDILKRAKAKEMSDVVFNVLVPTERVQEIKRGKRSESTRKFFPGYIIVNMHLLDENDEPIEKTWHFLRETNGVIGFAGNREKPTPMSKIEVEAILHQTEKSDESIKPKVQFEPGDKVKVADGPFENQTGVVEEVDPERGKLRVSVNIFGRDTPVELEYWQVEKA
ncbi:MAG: transcription termination/antitermination protein NusG [Chthoniobacterales bacterium]|nr:transcription termination/antitermination protein NusG [Chthoniobacterales bacterium]